MADVELLPLPHWMETYRIPSDDFHTGPDQYLSERMRAYACANLAALQAEVAEWKRVVAAQAELHGEAEARADKLADALKELITWIPTADTYRRLGFDPEAPMRAHEAAKAALAKGNITAIKERLK